MTPLFIFLVACLVMFLVFGYVAIRYPTGRADWGKGRSETATLVATLLTFVMLFLLLWYASATLEWPSAITVTFWSAACLVAALAVISVVYPEGLDASSIVGENER